MPMLKLRAMCICTDFDPKRMPIHLIPIPMPAPVRRRIIPLLPKPIPLPPRIPPRPSVIVLIPPPPEIIRPSAVRPRHGGERVVREQGVEPGPASPGVAVGALTGAGDEDVRPFAAHHVFPAAPGAAVAAVAGPDELRAAPGGAVEVDEGVAPGEGGWVEFCHGRGYDVRSKLARYSWKE